MESHHRIPELYGDETNVRRWVRIKREALVLGVKKPLTARPNGRSADFIAPSTANGCAMACAYCYVPRRKGYSNPITVFANIDKILGYVQRHAGRQGTNLGWHPKAEEVLWRPDIQQGKRSENGAWNVRYRTGQKGRHVAALTEVINRVTPYCRIRYAF